MATKQKGAKLNSAYFFTLLALISSLLLNAFLVYKQEIETGEYKVLAVLDGDTLVLENKVRLRLRNIDAPELEYCGGKEAKQALEKLINKHNIDISENILDQRGRPMALVYVNKLLVNQEILKQGWATYHHDQSSVAPELKKSADQAKKQNLGLYGKCIGTKPAKPECIIKGNIDNNSPYIKRYYRPGCVHYNTTIIELNNGEQWFCTEAEAKAAGYEKATRCPK